MQQGRVRLAIKLSTVTTLMVVSSAVAASATSHFLTDGYATLWIALFSLLSLGLGLLFTVILDRMITLPIRELVSQTDSMVANDYRAEVTVRTSDEIGDMAQAIDSLRRSFLNQRDALQELNYTLDGRVAERTQQLEEALQHLKATQEQLLRTEKLASIGRLARGLAHEINNPACVILTRVGLLADGARADGADEELVEGLEVISRQVARISRITRDLLTFSRQSPMRVGPMNLSEVVSVTASLYRYEAKKRQVEIRVDVDSGVMVKGDRDRLEQVCINLIKNALDAMEGQGGVLNVRLKVHNDHVRLVVEDTGPGLQETELGRIFDPFFTTKEVGKGTGLGLAISYGILEEHGGTIGVANRPGGGAVFAVTLPVFNSTSDELMMSSPQVTESMSSDNHPMEGP